MEGHEHLQALINEMRNNNAVQLKLIEYMQLDLEAKNQRIRQLEEKLSESDS